MSDKSKVEQISNKRNSKIIQKYIHDRINGNNEKRDYINVKITDPKQI